MCGTKSLCGGGRRETCKSRSRDGPEAGERAGGLGSPQASPRGPTGRRRTTQPSLVLGLGEGTNRHRRRGLDQVKGARRGRALRRSLGPFRLVGLPPLSRGRLAKGDPPLGRCAPCVVPCHASLLPGTPRGCPPQGVRLAASSLLRRRDRLRRPLLCHKGRAVRRPLAPSLH